MDWEMYDLDGDEVALRPASGTVKGCRPWRSPHSAKPLPRSAGSVNRAGRCEYVTELVDFCYDQSHPRARRSEQISSRKYLPPDSVMRHARSKSSRSSFNQPSGIRASKRRSVSRKPPNLRIMPGRRIDKNRESTNGEIPARPPRSPPRQLTRQSCGLQLLPPVNRVVSGGGWEKDDDRECRYPGVSLLPSPAPTDDSEDGADGQSVPIGERGEAPVESSAEVRGEIQFIDPWTETPIYVEESFSSDSAKSVMDSKGHTSNCSGASQTLGSDVESPATAATSPLGSPSTPQPEKHSVPQDQISGNSETRYLLDKSSGEKESKGKLSSYSTSLSPVPSEYSQEYLVSRLQKSLDFDLTPRSNSTPWDQSNDVRPLDNHTTGLGAAINASGVESGTPPHWENSVQHGDKNLAARSKSWDALFPKPPRTNRANTVHGVLSETDLANRNREDSSALATPTPSSGPSVPSGDEKMSRSARIFAARMRDMAVVRTGPPTTAQRGKASPAGAGYRQYRSTPVSPTLPPEKRSGRLSAQLPLRGPRSECPTPPPSAPLPVDPPFPPPRNSSRMGTYTSRSAAHSRKPSVEPLAEHAGASQSTPEKGASQENKLSTPRQPPSCHRRQLAQADNTIRESFPPQLSIAPCPSTPTSPGPSSPLAQRSGQVSVASENIGMASESRPITSFRGRTLSNARRQESTPLSPTSIPPRRSSRYSPRHLTPAVSGYNSPEPQSPNRLESRVAFLEQQNKMLQEALVAALGSRAGGGTNAMPHDSALTSPRSAKFPETPAPPSSRAPSVAGKRPRVDSLNPFGNTRPEIVEHGNEGSAPVLWSH